MTIPCLPATLEVRLADVATDHGATDADQVPSETLVVSHGLPHEVCSPPSKSGGYR